MCTIYRSSAVEIQVGQPQNMPRKKALPQKNRQQLFLVTPVSKVALSKEVSSPQVEQNNLCFLLKQMEKKLCMQVFSSPLHILPFCVYSPPIPTAFFEAARMENHFPKFRPRQHITIFLLFKHFLFPGTEGGEKLLCWLQETSAKWPETLSCVSQEITVYFKVSKRSQINRIISISHFTREPFIVFATNTKQMALTVVNESLAQLLQN